MIQDLKLCLPDENKAQLIEDFMTEFEYLLEMQEYFAEENAQKMNYRLETENALSAVTQVKKEANEHLKDIKEIFERIHTSYKSMDQNYEYISLLEDGIIPLNKVQQKIQRYFRTPQTLRRFSNAFILVTNQWIKTVNT